MSDCPTKLQLVPLHTHTVYSVLDGASTIDEYLKWCKANGSPAAGITDHGWLIGCLELYMKAKKEGITPIPGCEFYVAPQASHEFKNKPYDYYHVTAWAVNETGYRNLLKLGSISWNQDTVDGWSKENGVYVKNQKPRVVKKFGVMKPRITFEELLEHNEGLVLGSGCLIGAVNKCLLEGEDEGAVANLNRLLEVYRGRLFMEIMPHECTHDYNRKTKQFEENECSAFAPNGDLQKGANLTSIKLARENNIPLLLTVDSHFVEDRQKATQDVLLQNGDPDGWRFYNSYHMLTTEQAWDLWKRVYGSDEENQKIFTEAVESNHIIAEIAKDLIIKDGYHQPTPEIPQDIIDVAKDSSEGKKLYIMRQIDFHGRMQWNDPAWTARLQKEMQVICDNGIIDFSDYFIFLEKWNRWASENSILSAPGRGSGAGSLLCYLLKITHLDPFKYNLPFERFLSQARLVRAKYPDIDWDTGNREPLIAKMKETYGDKMAQCSTHQTLKVKSSIKDACRALLGWKANDPRVEDVTRTITPEPMGVLSRDFLIGYVDKDTKQFHDGHLMENPVLDAFFKKYPQVEKMVMELLGIPRAVGRHASAFLISDRPIYESVPVCDITGTGFECTQYTATAGNNMVEKAGLIKFDLLRVNTLDDIAMCIRLIQREMGYSIWEEKVTFNKEEFKITKGELSIEQIPLTKKSDPNPLFVNVYDLPEDPLVFDDIGKGNTQSCFQIQTSIMTPFCVRIQPKRVLDMSDIVALVRPGPLAALIEDGQTTMTEAYIKRRNGQMSVTYAHPDMEPIVKDTYGVFVYQEQLQQAFQDLAGYGPEEADELREILAKKQKQQLEQKLPKLRKALADRNWTENQIEVFVSACIASSAYSFNRAHSASYGYMAYVCAFLKYHFPLCWWTSVLTNAKIEDIREKGHAKTIRNILQLPHVNGPTDRFDLDKGKVHAPLSLISGVGEAACELIKAHQPYVNLQDFFEYVNPNQTVMHNLILTGAFAQIEPGRKVEDLMEEFHYLKRVTGLKVGKEKKGEDLSNAVKEYQALEKLGKYKPLEIPKLYDSHLESEIKRLEMLPIYRMDVHEEFKRELTNDGGIFYSTEGKHNAPLNGEPHYVLKSVNDIPGIWNIHHELNVAWAGTIQSQDTFQYKDRKTKQQVTACKLQIANDGDTIEVILWPDVYARLSQIPKGKIVIAYGRIKEARDQGKYCIYATEIRFI